MSSDRKIAANRANSAKSTGSKTPAGKAASSRNSLRHGLLADTVVLKGESVARFNSLLAALQDEFQPEKGVEVALIENMAVTRWRQMRLWAFEDTILANQLRQLQLNLSTFRILNDEYRLLAIISRHESRLERQFNRALNSLLQGRRKK